MPARRERAGASKTAYRQSRRDVYSGRVVADEPRGAAHPDQPALDTPDAGKLLTRLGYPEGVRRGKAKLEGALAWSGAPYDFDYPTLGGGLLLEVQRGQFTKLDPHRQAARYPEPAGAPAGSRSISATSSAKVSRSTTSSARSDSTAASRAPTVSASRALRRAS